MEQSMKILLIYPQYTHNNSHDFRAPSMSLMYIAAELEKRNHKVSIYDASLGPITKKNNIFYYGVTDEEVLKFLSKNEFDLVGITCSFTARWKFVKKIAEQVKQISQSTPVIVGGLFPTYQWKFCLENCDAVDCVMLGESELNFAQIVDNLSINRSIDDACKNVEGTAWKFNNEFFCNQKEKYNDKLDELTFPAWHLLDLKRYFSYQKNIYDLASPYFPILTSRSCSNRCRFCNMHITHGYRWRARTAKNILDEIEFLLKKYQVCHFYVVDDNFSFDAKRAKQICREIIKRNLKIKYNFYNGLSIKSLDFELIQLMKDSGCTSACLAIESGSEYVRNEIYGKKLNTTKIFEVFNWFKKVKIRTIGFFMVGAPGEKRSDFEETKKLVAKLPMNFATVGIFTPYPETELYDECKKNGWLLDDSIRSDNEVEMLSPVLRTPDFSPEEVNKWQREFYFNFIRYHWFELIKEFLRKDGLVNFKAIFKTLENINFTFLKRENFVCDAKRI
jgi:radical SAM superfamily enzyme YgiQ (UPF0313 family)